MHARMESSANTAQIYIREEACSYLDTTLQSILRLISSDIQITSYAPTSATSLLYSRPPHNSLQEESAYWSHLA